MDVPTGASPERAAIQPPTAVGFVESVAATQPEDADAPRHIDHISICICTFKRPELLTRLLESIAQQITDGTFTFDVVVVDNDTQRSAEPSVERFRTRSGIVVRYDCEPNQNISLTRNRAIRNACGNLVAFIDDDERPVPEWLRQLHGTLCTANAWGVLGPVLPDFPVDAPSWIRKGKFFDRRRSATGSTISMQDARTGNVLFKRSVFKDDELWFDPAYGRTGGEDSDFFIRQFARGGHYVWSDEAVAYEAVPANRLTGSFLARRSTRAGTLDGEAMRAGTLSPKGIIGRSALILTACIGLLPVSLLLPKHLRMYILFKLVYCAGILTGYWGFSILRYRE